MRIFRAGGQTVAMRSLCSLHQRRLSRTVTTTSSSTSSIMNTAAAYVQTTRHVGTVAGPPPTQVAATTSASASAPTPTHAGPSGGLSPFLSELLDPPLTVDLPDATRTYGTMELIQEPERYDPVVPNLRPRKAILGSVGKGGGENEGSEASSPLHVAHAAGELWRHCASSSAAERAANRPAAWFEQLCRDLYFREGGGGDATTATAAAPMARIASSSADGEEPVDPYAWLPFQLLDEAAYTVGPYHFPPSSPYTHDQQTRLRLGAAGKEYVHFCDTYAFPARYQLPTSIGTKPARLLMDPACDQPVVYLQLADDFPPAMWLPVRGTAAAVRRVVSVFAQQAVRHRDSHHDTFERRFAEAQRVRQLQGLASNGSSNGHDDGDALRFLAYDARNAPYTEAPLREFVNEQEFFLGEHHDPETLLERLDLCPFLFAVPHMRTFVDPHAAHATPTVDGPGVAPSLYRCIYSKALVLVSVQLSAEVKLPPQDPEAFHHLWKDAQAVPAMKIPVFARVVWPDEGRKMSADGLLTRRFNALFGAEFASDVPVDAVMALFYVMAWAERLPDFLGVRGMRERVAELEAAVLHAPQPPLLYPGTRELPNPEYTLAERLGMHVQYLAQLGDPAIADTLRHMLQQPGLPAAVRMGSAKAALIAGERAIYRQIVSQEPPGRTQLYMTKLTRKRKARDLVDPEPRLLDDQYEFAAPLWTKRGTRLDRNTLEGAVDAATSRLAR